MLAYLSNVNFSQNLLDRTKFYQTCPSVLHTWESLVLSTSLLVMFQQTIISIIWTSSNFVTGHFNNETQAVSTMKLKGQTWWPYQRIPNTSSWKFWSFLYLWANENNYSNGNQQAQKYNNKTSDEIHKLLDETYTQPQKKCTTKIFNIIFLDFFLGKTAYAQLIVDKKTA